MNLVVSVGLSINDLNYIDYSTLMDMIIEKGNDSYKYSTLATQADFDRF